MRNHNDNTSNGMSVVMLSTDRKIFEDDSAVQARLAAFGECFGTMHIIVFSTKAHRYSEPKQIGTNVWVYPTNSRSRWLYWLDALRLAQRLEKPDVVTTQDPFETGFVGAITASMKHTPLHVQVHTDLSTPHFAQHSFLNRVRVRLAQFVLRRASGVRVVSEEIKESLKVSGYRLKTEPSVLPVFVDLEKYANLTRTKHPRFKIALLCVGRLEKEKRFDRAINALALARAKGHDAGLTIVGAGGEEEHLREYAHSLMLDQKVEFAGWQDDLRPYLAAADIVLVPSEYEGYGLVIIEALSAGVPVLATDVGIAREAGAMVVDAEEFPEALTRWIETGSRQGELQSHPYHTFDDYVAKWCEDIKACVHP